MEDLKPFLIEIRDLLVELVRTQKALLANQHRIMEDMVEPLKEMKQQAERMFTDNHQKSLN